MTDQPDFGNLCKETADTCPHCGSSLPDDFTTGYECPKCDEYVFTPPELPERIQQAIGYMQMLIEALEEHGDSPQLMRHLTPGQFIVFNQVLEEADFEETHA